MIKILEKSLIKWIGISRYLTMQIDITNFCNLSCSHCYHPHHKNHNAISLNDWFQIIDQYEALLLKMNAKAHIVICGGEPLASQFLIPLLENLLSRNTKFHLSILTNGTLLERVDLSVFKNFPHVDFQVSLDGHNSALHDSFRGKGNFIKALKGIEILKKEMFDVLLQVTLTKNNSFEINKYFDLASSLQVDALNFTRLITIGFGKKLIQDQVDQTLKPLELKKAFEDILINSARTGIRSSTEHPLMNLIHPTLGKKQRFYESIIIDYKGNLLVSSRSRFELGSVLNNNLENLFLKNSLRQKLKNDEIEDCSKCPHFNYCGGDRNASYAEYGNFFKKDPGCWIDIKTISA